MLSPANFNCFWPSKGLTAFSYCNSYDRVDECTVLIFCCIFQLAEKGNDDCEVSLKNFLVNSSVNTTKTFGGLRAQAQN